MILLNQSLETLAEVARVTQTLSVGYSDANMALDVRALAAGVGSSRQVDVFEIPACPTQNPRTSGEHSIDAGTAYQTIAEDLQRWIAIREPAPASTPLIQGPSSSAIWKGHNTDPALLAVVMRLQASLAACVEGRAWSDDGFDLYQSGASGPRAEGNGQR